MDEAPRAGTGKDEPRGVQDVTEIDGQRGNVHADAAPRRVERIPHQGVSTGRHVDAYLVGPSHLDANFHEA